VTPRRSAISTNQATSEPGKRAAVEPDQARLVYAALDDKVRFAGKLLAGVCAAFLSATTSSDARSVRGSAPTLHARPDRDTESTTLAREPRVNLVLQIPGDRSNAQHPLLLDAFN